MAKYIDRDGYIKSQRELYCKNCPKREGMRNGRKQELYPIGGVVCRACELDDALDALEDYPAADVAPVVRCKDCGSWSANFPDDGWGWCFNSVIGEGERSADCYCAYGAKMEVGE